ncbi:hypothetical protein [Curvibacter sp. CHRR-16]|uniref:LpxL/LpxP family acyltransferase n=1 Tax=Curvibacter sp. CHRR-16 TaxID=2835872 RepID=UPI0032EA6C92
MKPAADHSPSSPHWARMAERGSALGLRLLMLCQRMLGVRATMAVLYPVVLYFWCTARVPRQASLQFWQRVDAMQGHTVQRGWAARCRAGWRSYQHMLAFARSGVDKLRAWRDGVPASEVVLADPALWQRLLAQTAQGQGALLIGAHLGNLEMLRAIATREHKVVVNAVVFTEHAVRFNAMLEGAHEGFALNLLQVRSMGADTAILLRQKIEQGELVVIVGDRTPPFDNGRVVKAQFLGQTAAFAQGPMVLAHLLECPVYLFFGLREGASVRVVLEPFAQQVQLPRAGRDQALAQWVQRYADRLGHYALQYPQQWFNFFDFWRTP